MIIIPPALKLVAGFKADEDVTMSQIIAALEKKFLRIPGTQISNMQKRQAKFQSLLNKRARELPNESYEARFNAVANSKVGEELFAQMKRSESDENFGNQFSDQKAEKAPSLASGSGLGGFNSKEEAKATFIAHVDDLTSKGLSRDQAWTTAAATEPGKSAYSAWKTLAAAERPEVVSTPPISTFRGCDSESA